MHLLAKLALSASLSFCLLLSAVGQTANEANILISSAYKSAVSNNFDKCLSAVNQALSLTSVPDEQQIYALYLKALSEYRLGQYQQAGASIAFVNQRFPKASNNNELKYLSALVKFGKNESKAAINELLSINDNHFTTDIDNAIAYQLKKLKRNDAIEIARQLPACARCNIYAIGLLKDSKLRTEQELYKEFLSRPGMDKYAKTKNKNRYEKVKTYSVAVLLPLTLKNNQLSAITPMPILNFYQGLQLAIDSILAQSDIKIDYKVFDTKNDSNQILRLLSDPSFAKFDFIIGPIFANGTPLVHDYITKNNIFGLNPLTNNTHDLPCNQRYYFTEPSIETNAQAIITHIAQTQSIINLGIITSDQARDTLFANAIVKNLGIEQGDVIFKVKANTKLATELKKHFKPLPRGFGKKPANASPHWEPPTEKEIQAITNPNEIKAIIFAGLDGVSATRQVAQIEMAQANVPIYAPSDWLANTPNTPDRWYKQKVQFYGGYIYQRDSTFDGFVNRFADKYGQRPNDFSVRGFQNGFLLFDFLNEIAHHQGKVDLSGGKEFLCPFGKIRLTDYKVDNQAPAFLGFKETDGPVKTIEQQIIYPLD